VRQHPSARALVSLAGSVGADLEYRARPALSLQRTTTDMLPCWISDSYSTAQQFPESNEYQR